jgi:hypothetical protein
MLLPPAYRAVRKSVLVESSSLGRTDVPRYWCRIRAEPSVSVAAQVVIRATAMKVPLSERTVARRADGS